MMKVNLVDMEFIRLVKQAKRGSQDAFTQICELRQRKIFFYCLNVLGGHEDAEDASQETILQMWKSIGSLKKPESFDAWMMQIARSKCFYLLKKRNRSEEVLLFTDANGVTPDIGADIEDIDEEVIPEKYAENAELSQVLYQAITELPAKRREALIMYYYAGLSTSEIAKITGSSPNAVTGVITKARNQLKEMLAAMEKVFIMGVLPGESVIGRVLESQADRQITNADLQHLESVWRVAVVGATPYAAIAKNYMKAIGIGASAAACVFTGIAIGANTDTNEISAPPAVISEQGSTPDISDRPNATEEVSPAETETDETVPVSRDGSIIFTGDCDCGHMNPRSALLADNPADEEAVAWRITKKGSEAVLASGGGKDASGGVASLGGVYDAYTLVYTVRGEDDSAVEFSRDFAIGDETDAARKI
jgi:RNA polymerase sigma-70 factor (ECF subfamily)